MTKPENLASRRIESRRVVLGGAILAIIATVVVSTLTAGNPVSASTTRAAAVVGASRNSFIESDCKPTSTGISFDVIYPYKAYPGQQSGHLNPKSGNY